MPRRRNRLWAGASSLALAMASGYAPLVSAQTATHPAPAASTLPPTPGAANATAAPPANEAPPAVAQSPLRPASTAEAEGGSGRVEEIVVTGTSIRGVAPVGSNLISVGRDNIETTNAQTPQQILKSVPAVTGLGSAGQGSFGSADASGTNAPSIHGLGASASSSTLILIDGHRLPLSGVNHTLADPNILPTVAIERVEVLPDGASSVYGSDAVAGVINFITRKHYEGLEISGQTGFADNYSTYNGNILWGKAWGTGSALVAYSYSDRTRLKTGDRDYTALDHRDQGGTNLASFACGPASIQQGSNIYAYPYTNGSVSSVQSNAFCDYSGLADLLPREHRNNVLAKVTQDYNDKLTLNADVIYSDRTDRADVTRGSLTATVFGPGSGKGGQINPFFVRPPGTTATSETVLFDADQLLGNGAKTFSGARDVVGDVGAEYRFSEHLHLTVGGTFGEDDSRLQTLGQLCTSCAYLALNGTTNGAGSLTTASIPGTSTIILNTPLTAANSLDVFNPPGSNRTPASLLSQLTDSANTQLAHQTLEDERIKLDGDLFRLPAGPVRFAVGGETVRYTLRQDITRPNNTGPATTGSSSLNIYYSRRVNSAFGEILIPAISPDMDIPLVRSLDFDISGRYDDYSDFGSTKNPKFGATWEVVRGFKIRGNYAESFVAPSLTSIGSQNGITGESGYATYGQGTVNVPVATFPGVVGLPNCPAGSATCVIGTSNVPGLLINGGNANLQPQTGKTYSVGFDYTPDFVPGLRMSLTYFTNQLRGGVTSPTAALALNAANLNYLFSFYPNGATPAQIAAKVGNLPQTGAIPATTYFIYDFRQQNVLNLNIEGIDASIAYAHATRFGKFNLGGSVTQFTKFDQQIGAGSPWFSVLNTVGFNTTFPSIQTQARANFGYGIGDLGAELFVNYVGGFQNYSSTTVLPVTKNAAGYPIGGGDDVDSYTTVDIHISYGLHSMSFAPWMKESEVYVDVNNLFDADPPFFNSTTGYTTFSGNPIGRIVSIGFRAKL